LGRVQILSLRSGLGPVRSTGSDWVKLACYAN